MNESRFKWLGLVFVAVLIGSLLSSAFTSSASAETPSRASSASSADDCDTDNVPDGDTDYTFTTCVSANGSTKVKSVASGKASVDSRGRLILSYVMPNGLPESQRNRCYHPKPGSPYVNNYYDSTGKERWKKKRATKGDVFCYDDRGVLRRVKCGNIVKPPTANVPIVKVKTVERRKQKIWSEAEAKAAGASTSSVVAVQTAGPCAGSKASAEATGSFLAFARARAWGWTKRQSLLNVQGAARSLNIEQQAVDSAKANAKAKARGSAKTKVDAKIVCNQPPCQENCQPPGSNPPVIVQFREFNDLEVNWTSDHCVTVDFPDGHNGSVFWTAQYGSFATPTKSAQDMIQVCSTYKAPSEVPPGGHDTITVTATDATTGKSVSKTSAPFVIHPTAPHPF